MTISSSSVGRKSKSLDLRPKKLLISNISTQKTSLIEMLQKASENGVESHSFTSESGSEVEVSFTERYKAEQVS